MRIKSDKPETPYFCIRCNALLPLGGGEMLCTDCQAWARAVEESSVGRFMEELFDNMKAAEQRRREDAERKKPERRTFASFLMEKV